MLAALRRHRPTALHLRPPQVGQILSHPGFDPALLARVRKGGGRAEWFQPHLDPAATRMITGYGMTETAGYVTALDWRDPPEVRATQIGHPLPGRRAAHRRWRRPRLRGPASRAKSACARPGLFSGYYKQPPGTGLDADGFFCTGDLGCIDADGVFHFSGRSKDLLRVKGINVSPVEVETRARHPSGGRCGLRRRPAARRARAGAGRRRRHPRRRAAARSRAARAWRREELSHYKRPARYVHIRHADVPLSGTAKPQRAALAELAALVRHGMPCLAVGASRVERPALRGR